MRKIVALACAVSVVLVSVAGAQGAATTRLGQKVAGTLDPELGASAYTVDMVAGTKVTAVAKGDGFTPRLTLVALDTFEVVGTAVAKGKSAKVSKVIAPRTGRYLLRVESVDTPPSGAEFLAFVKGKSPPEARRPRIKSSEPAGVGLPFDAAAGSMLKATIKLQAGPNGVPFFQLEGPGGQALDVNGATALNTKGNVAKLASFELPATGTYRLVPTGADVDIVANLSVKTPKPPKNSQGDPGALVVFPYPQLPAPTLSVPQGPLDAPTVTVSGSVSKAASTVCVTSPAGKVSFAVDGGSFSGDVPLAANQVNVVTAVALGAQGNTSMPTSRSVVVDTSAPSVAITSPLPGFDVAATTVDVTGTVIEMLGGVGSVTVTVDGNPATVTPASATNGSFHAVDVPVSPGRNTLTIQAVDALGNAVTKTHVVQVDAVDSALPTIELLSGAGQSATIGSVLDDPIAVLVRDIDGQPLIGKPVTFTIARGDGGFAETSSAGAWPTSSTVLTDQAGRASTWWRIGTEAGAGNNLARVEGVGIQGGVCVSASGAVAAARLVHVSSGNDQTAQAGGTALAPLVARVTDGTNPVAGVPVTFTVVGDGAVDGVSEATVATDAAGFARVTLTLAGLAGITRVDADFKGNEASPACFRARGLPSSSNGTTFVGVVTDIVGRPIEGAVCTLEPDFASQLTTTTDAVGRFTFSVPDASVASLDVDASGPVFVDGVFADAGTYPHLTYDAVPIVAGAVNGLERAIILPRLDAGVPYDGTSDVVVACDGIDGLAFTVAAGSMTLADGSQPVPGAPVTVSVSQVPFDRIPMPLPDGRTTAFAWTMQPAGATFDPPVQVVMPNFEGLPPGQVVPIQTFDHATGRFEIVGTGTVSLDGSRIRSDTGSGLTLAGWGGPAPPPPPAGEVEVEPDDECPGEVCTDGCADLATAILALSADAMGVLAVFTTNYPGQHLDHFLGGSGTPIHHDKTSQPAQDLLNNPLYDKIKSNLDKIVERAVEDALFENPASTSIAQIYRDILPFDLCSAKASELTLPFGPERLCYGFGTMEHRVPATPSGFLTPSSVVLNGIVIDPILGTYEGTAEFTFRDWYSFLGYPPSAYHWPNPYGWYLETICSTAEPFTITVAVEDSVSGTVATQFNGLDDAVVDILDGIAGAGPDSLLGAADPADAVVSILGQTGVSKDGGGWTVFNVPVSDAPVRASLVLSHPAGMAVPWYASTAFGSVAADATTTLTLGAPTPFPLPTPVALEFAAPAPIDKGATAFLDVMATLSDGTIVPVPGFVDGTVYTSSNQAIATVDADGAVTGVFPGEVFITASNSGLSTARLVEVVGGTVAKTVVGRVELAGGAAAVGAVVTSTLAESAAVTDGAGAFSLVVDVAENDSSIGLDVAYDIGSETLLGGAVVSNGPSTLLDAGTITLVSQCTGGTWSPVGSTNPPTFDGAVNVILPDPVSGDVYVGGRFGVDPEDIGPSGVARWDGTSWHDVGGFFDDDVEDLVFFDAGDGSGPQLYAGGSFTVAGGQPAFGTARWDGSSWQPLDGLSVSIWGDVEDLLVHDDGSGAGPRLFVAGNLTWPFVGGMRVVAWDGTDWNDVNGATFDDTVTALAVHDAADGLGPQLWAAGEFVFASSEGDRHLARWNGTTWASVAGSTWTGSVYDMLSFDTGTGGGAALIVGGLFVGADLSPEGVLSLTGATWESDVIPGFTFVYDLLVDETGPPRLYATGVPAGGAEGASVVAWDGQAVDALGDGLNGFGFSLGHVDQGSSSTVWVGALFFDLLLLGHHVMTLECDAP